MRQEQQEVLKQRRRRRRVQLVSQLQLKRYRCRELVKKHVNKG